MDLYSCCVLAFDKHVFVSWRAPHSTSPCKDTTLTKFHSHLSALVLRACGSATWSVRTPRVKSLHVHICRDIFPPILRIVTEQLFTGISRSLLLAGRALFHVRVRRASEQHAHTQVRHSTSRAPPQKLRDARRVSRAKFASRAFVYSCAECVVVSLPRSFLLDQVYHGKRRYCRATHGMSMTSATTARLSREAGTRSCETHVFPGCRSP